MCGWLKRDAEMGSFFFYFFFLFGIKGNGLVDSRRCLGGWRWVYPIYGRSYRHASLAACVIW